MYRDGAVHCDKPLCFENVKGDKGEALMQAYREGWHISPCKCPARSTVGQKWKHRQDYCPGHYPFTPRLVEDLPPL